MQLTFEEKTLKFLDGVDVNIDLGVFIDEYMKAYKAKQTKAELGETLGISHIDVSLIATKLANIGVKLPELRIKIWNRVWKRVISGETRI